MTGPQPAVARTAAELAETLDSDFDLVDFLHLLTARSQQALGVEAVGLLLVDDHGELNVVAASNEQARVLDLWQLENAEGPCVDCYRTGRPVSCPDLQTESGRWGRFVPQALDAGFAAVHALPVRLRDKVIGVMNLFTTVRGGLHSEVLAVGQALTDAAAVALLHERATHQHLLLVEQLKTALDSQSTIDQAKGSIAERAGVWAGEVLELLRSFAHRQHQTLNDMAKEVVQGSPLTMSAGNERRYGNGQADLSMLAEDRRRTQRPVSTIGFLEQLPAFALLQRLPMSVIAIDCDGTIRYANPAAMAMLGYTEGTLLDRPLTHFLVFDPSTPAAQVVNTLREAAGTVTTWRHEQEGVIKVIVSESMLLRADDPLLVVGLTDVTDWLWSHGRAKRLT